jgi:hypothetical protein
MSLFKQFLIMGVAISAVFVFFVTISALTGVDLTLLVACLIVGLLISRR